MRRIAFITGICGMLVLALLLSYSRVNEVDSAEDLTALVENTRVSLIGWVVEERMLYEGTRLFVFENGVEAVCSCGGGVEGTQVEILGVVSEYEGKKQVTVEKIYILE